MSKAFLAQVIQETLETTGVAANRAAASVIDAIVTELKKNGKFALPSFGTFTVKKTKARKGLNPRTGEPIKVKAGKTVGSVSDRAQDLVILASARASR